MAKHPVPKRKSSKTRTKRRYSTWESGELKRLTNKSKTVACPKCKQPRLPHTACSVCGYYRGRVVIDLVAKDSKKVQKVKA
ncbi:50S ribosomal protein L32 [Candidatus Gracilibacteria bacterium]|nr:50S ribosomal protein L32 [Candidatus Gracilibacteria bacterium]MCF7856306.1 50S ribosomal protein L32 [Candidatus Gracilibacteria bacterium]MCF7896661.1 50S ribosomal protein L32 [Candidatus Gracilibacteria bacterium]